MPLVDSCLRVLDTVCPPLARWARGVRQKRYWEYRTRETISCADNAFIERVPDAGRIIGEHQVMHNGLRVFYGSYSYFAEEMHEILRQNRGVHEPQEERAFAAVLPHVAPGGVILELGACWAFYSLWFAARVPDARVFLIEADPVCLANGRRNFALNGRTATLIEAWVGEKNGRGPAGERLLGIDDFLAEQKIDHVAILHSDIQGAELDMLKGAEQALRAGRIDYLFVSTHSDAIHEACAQFLRERGYAIIASANVSQSYSVDGVLVAKRSTLPQPGPIPIAQRQN
jgi:hypothetical protein